VPEHLDQLEDWFSNRPKWLQDAARRILQNGRIKDDDVPQLVALCKSEVGLSHGAPGTLKPIGIPKGIFSSSKTPTKLHLNSISQPKGINALAPRRPLEFGDEPLAVVYGPNGSGKSGYVRALKHACGVRRPGELLGNVFIDKSEEASCRFNCSINGTAHEFPWAFSQGAIAAMTLIQIYDNTCAGIYIDEENEVAFEPPILRLFTKLTDLCGVVNSSLEAEIQSKGSKRPMLPVEFQGTKSAVWYESLTRLSKPEEIATMCTWTPDKESELTEINLRLNESKPAEKASTLRKQETHLIELNDELNAWRERLSEERCEVYALAHADSTAKRQAARVSASTVFANAPLGGVGSETWKLLWQQARLYSEEYAYRGTPFPNAGPDARCVLCQQLLDSEAQRRLVSFEAFVRGGLETQAVEAEARLRGLSDNLLAIAADEVKLRLDSGAFNSESSRESILSFRDALERRNTVLLDTGSNTSLPDLPDLGILKLLTDQAKKLEELALSLDQDAKVENRPALENSSNELRALKWISQQRSAIESELTRLNELHKLDQARKLCSTQQLSVKKSNLAEELITTAYVHRFQGELNALQARHVRVKLTKTQAERGHVLHKIQLEGCTKPVNTSDVLSEGEFRIVSLAAFLADVEGREDKGPFVFDDPITSSDQYFEEATARKLVDICQSRQVIVFTHRLSLVELLEEAAKRAGVKTSKISLRRAEWGIGDPDETYIHTNPAAGLKSLLGKLPQARTALLQSTGEYELAAKGICSYFRIIIEHLVEKVLLADVLTRFRRSIETKGKIRDLAKIDAADCILIDDLMTKYSKFEHFQPLETPIQLPGPDELEADINRALTWLEEFKRRPVT
jgi:energy-coupling factor transporter ATP-binding protein EcfA2